MNKLHREKMKREIRALREREIGLRGLLAERTRQLNEKAEEVINVVAGGAEVLSIMSAYLFSVCENNGNELHIPKKGVNEILGKYEVETAEEEEFLHIRIMEKAKEEK